MADPLEKLILRVEPEHAGTRLDQFLARRAEGFSRSRLKALIQDRQVSAHGKVLDDPNARVVAGSEILLRIPATTPAGPQPQSIALKILYEDEDVIVIDKPAGL